MSGRRRFDPARATTVGLALTLAFLAGFAVFSAYTTETRADEANRADKLAESYSSARFSVAAEESLERKYRLEPGPDILAMHRAAGDDLVAALAEVRAIGGPADARFVDGTLILHSRYLDATARMFAAIDANDVALANRIDADEVDQIFDAIQTRVFAMADERSATAERTLADLGSLQRGIFALTVVVFLLGSVLLVVFYRVLQASRRATARAVEHELEQARASEERFRSVVQNASDVIAILDADGRVIYRSPAATRLWRPLPAAAAALDLVHPDDGALARSHFAQVVASPNATVSTELRLEGPEGSWRDFEVTATNLLDRPGVCGVVAIFHDVTERKAFERQLSTLAFYDQLTALPNRALLVDRVGQALARRGRRPGSVALLFLDLDNFKLINDSLGHDAGDQVLVATARRIRDCVRAEDTAARIGGDEFVLLLESVGAVDEAVATAERVAAAIRAPLQLGSRELFLDVSVGIALSGDRAEAPESLVRKADLAMYRAKSTGKARVAVFDDAMSKDVVERLELETDLRRAIERDELRVHYQPIVTLETGEVRELEALVRWEHPTRGLVPPLAFIPLAEETGLIHPIGQWVLDESLRQLAEWGPAAEGIGLSVNLSARQFRNPDLASDIRAALERSGVRSDRLKLEITETVVMEDSETAARQLEAIRGLGVRLAIDDFGTGYSSLSYLSRFPVDTLKIDRSFVRRIGSGSREEVGLLRGIIALAQTMNLSVIAEGIETEEQQRLLESFGCDLGQGYLFARPGPAARVVQLLGRNARTEPTAVA